MTMDEKAQRRPLDDLDRAVWSACPAMRALAAMDEGREPDRRDMQAIRDMLLVGEAMTGGAT